MLVCTSPKTWTQVNYVWLFAATRTVQIHESNASQEKA